MPALPNTHPVYVGIDPGKSGGLVVMVNGECCYMRPMPNTEREVWDWFKKAIMAETPITLARGLNVRAVIERVHSSPQMGVTSAFTFGQGYGFLRGCLVAAGIPFQEVTPQTWMKGLGIPVRKRGTDKKQGKLQLLKVAQQLFPNLPLWNEPKSKGRQLAVCDALLIAEYCRRTNG